MRSTFRVLFYTKNRAIKNGRVPIMGRITVNGTTASFSCKRDVPLALWDAKGNCAKGKSEEARRLNQELENIKAQIGKHYQYLTDHDTFVSAKKVYDRYNGFGEDIHSLMEIFNIQIQDYKRQVGKTKAQSTYQGLLDEYKCLSHYLKDKLGAEDVPLMSLDVDFIKNYYNWMLSVRGLAKSTAFERVNTLKWLMYLAMDEGWIHKHPFKKFTCKPEYKKRPFLSEEDLQRVISVKLSYKRQQAIRDMFVFMCFQMPVGFSLYYGTSNIFMMLQTVLTYKVYNPEKFKAQYEAEVAAKRAAKKEIKTVTVEEGGKKVEKNVNKRQLDQMRLEYARKLDAEKYANDRTVPLTDEQRAEMEAQKAQKGKKKK